MKPPSKLFNMPQDQEILTHQGRSFAVERKPDPDSPYVLHGQRADYALLRTKPKPHLLFAVGINTGKGRFTVPRNMWFTDESGALRSLTP